MNSTDVPLQTYFAPPERLADEALAAQVAEMENLGSLVPLLDSMPDIVMILNGQRQILYGNKVLRAFASTRNCLRFEGLRPGELLSCRNVAEAPCGCGTGMACRTCGAVNAILAALSGKSARLECHISTATNDAFDLGVFANPFQWHGRDYVLVVASDIGDQKRRQVLERIFFHDILNTASGIQTIADLLAADPEAVAELAPGLRAAAVSLVGEIKSQRVLLAAETRELEVEPTVLSARAELEKVMQVFRHHRVAEGRRIIIDPATPGQPFLSDPALLERILGNLLKNALEAVAPGDTVRLGARVEALEIVFWCHNGGCIPPAAQLQIFQRSFSTKGAGRGIGTYSVRLLTERYLGGRVCFLSTQAGGTRFEVALPLQPAEVAPA